MSELSRQSLAVVDALFADGDSLAAVQGARALERQLGTPLGAAERGPRRNSSALPQEPGAPVEIRSAAFARYAAGQYHLKLGSLGPVHRAIADLRQAKPHPDSAWQAEEPLGQALLLEAQLAAREHSPEAGDLLRQLDSVLANPRGPFIEFGRPPFFSYGNLLAARLHEDAGDTAGALAAIRRRFVGIATFPEYVRYRREEGRLAALLGDTAGAIRAYRHYLALRSAPEPRLRPQADTVRRELTALLGAAGQD
jgi:hypothetical protein